MKVSFSFAGSHDFGAFSWLLQFYKNMIRNSLQREQEVSSLPQTIDFARVFFFGLGFLHIVSFQLILIFKENLFSQQPKV